MAIHFVDGVLQEQVTAEREPKEPRIAWPSPTPEMIATPEFEAVWQCIKRWDINVPNVYVGYMGANGSHVLAILEALKAVNK